MYVLALARLLAAVTFAALLAAPAWAQTPARPPVDAFFQNPAFGGAILSPTGRQIAVSVAPKSGRSTLVVMDTERLTAKVVAAFNDADIGGYEWVNDKRLVFWVVDPLTAQGDMMLGSGLFAVNADGTDLRQLVARGMLSGNTNMLPASASFLGTTRDKNSDDIFVVVPEYNHYRYVDYFNLLRVNTVTGRSSTSRRPGNSMAWLTDSNDVPRFTMTVENEKNSVWYNDPATQEWRKLVEFDPLETGNSGFTPLAVGPDNTLYVTAQRGDKSAVFRYDLAKKQLEKEPLISLKDYDFDGSLVFRDGKLVGAQYLSDAYSAVWLDDKFKQLQQKVDALLPNTINMLQTAIRPELPIVSVFAFSDVEPGTTLLYNTDTGKLTVLGSRVRDIDPRQMAHTDLIQYRAGDGLTIPAYLTVPRGKSKDLPMVVLVHGGPWVRGTSWGWQPDAQFLASRGYAVLQPAFRGTLGLGREHFRSSWKQWGLKMQSDVADGARWAIARGIADPKRICIAGASYGGYATLMGLITDPDLFRCGFNWVGVTDIDLMFSVSWSDTSDEIKGFGMKRMIGDPEKDAAQFKATSPLYNASKITQPLMLAYGGADRRVPLVHGLKFRDAVQRTNNQVEWIEYTEEGHGWHLVKNNVDFWTRVEKFLDRNIGNR